MSPLRNTHPHGPENEAYHALQTALAALVAAQEKCVAADYGGVHVLQPLDAARKEIEQVIAVVEGRS